VRARGVDLRSLRSVQAASVHADTTVLSFGGAVALSCDVGDANATARARALRPLFTRRRRRSLTAAAAAAADASLASTHSSTGASVVSVLGASPSPASRLSPTSPVGTPTRAQHLRTSAPPLVDVM
jgi:hypothetical protein